jgi:glutaredoxin
VRVQAILYGWSTCGHCERARELLERHGVETRVEWCDGRRALFERVQRQHGRATAPVVLLDGELVGGLAELQALAASGALGDVRRDHAG